MTTILWHPSSVLRVAINTLLCVWNELSRVLLGTCAICHAHTVVIEVHTTRSMHHIGLDNGIYAVLDLLHERYFSHNDFVNGIWLNFECRLQPKMDVDMGKSTLLEFNGVEPGLRFSKSAILEKFHQLFQFQLKELRQLVWPIM